MERKEKIRAGYKRGAKQYDNLLATQSWWAKLACKLVWGFPDTAYTEGLLARLSDAFSGRLLDVPVGTGLFTAEKYRNMKNAQITCVDYSQEMLDQAKNRFQRIGIKNVDLQRGDVGALPYADGAFDMVLSMNGFHAFPDKEAAFREAHRVLKRGGAFFGCFYVCKEVKRTDWFIKNIYVPKGYFTPPFYTKQELKSKLEKMYHDVEVWNVGGIACFSCVK